MIGENENWLLSYYRTSEIGGALFFGRLARVLGPDRVQIDMSRHFSEEAHHAWLWTSCIEQLGGQPLRLNEAYQDQYVAEVGLPANLMEVLALTQVFERRVIHQYARHARVPGLPAVVADTLAKIQQDELWHLAWVREALERMKVEYPPGLIAATLERYARADREIYRKSMQEHEERLRHLFGAQARRAHGQE